jgi:hypothetical protein
LSITASGVYGLTLAKQLDDTLAKGMGSETNVYTMLVTDGYTPDYDAHDFRNDITNEIAGADGYTTGGELTTTTTITTSTNGTVIYDATDRAWVTSTITDAMAAIGYWSGGVASTSDELFWLSDFVTAASSANGTFTVQWSSGGIIIYDFTP